jgi:hypothetical protein
VEDLKKEDNEPECKEAIYRKIKEEESQKLTDKEIVDLCRSLSPETTPITT